MSILFLVVGNSGAGKDSLIQQVQKEYPRHLPPLRVPLRVITRPPSPETENFESVDEETFSTMKREGCFILDWVIYGCSYGIRKEVVTWLAQGYPVMINVSRLIIPVARQLFPSLKVIFIRVPLEISENRLKERGREDQRMIDERLNRAKENQECAEADLVVDNTGDLDSAAHIILDYVLSFLTRNNSDD